MTVPRGFIRAPLAWGAVLFLLAAAGPAGAVSGTDGPDGSNFYSYSGDLALWDSQATFAPDVTQATLALGAATLVVGQSDAGSFSALAGAQFSANRLLLGYLPTSSATVNISGAGTFAQLNGTAVDRLTVGAQGMARLTISAGAVVDAASNATGCTHTGSSCESQVGGTAGATASLLLTDPGSRLSTQEFNVGTVYVDQGWGVPGGSTSGALNVLNGAQLNTLTGNVGMVWGGPLATGTERAQGQVLLDGPGTQWNIAGGGAIGSHSYLALGGSAGATGTMTMSNQAQLYVDGTQGSDGAIVVGMNGGTGSFSVLSGAQATATLLLIGNSASAQGTALIDGAGSIVRLSGVSSSTLNPGYQGAPGFLAIAAEGGNGAGALTVSNGGMLLITDGGGNTAVTLQNPGFNVSKGAGTGSLTIAGAGSEVKIVATSLGLPAGTPDNYNPYASIGRGAGSNGSLMISDGGALVLVGNALSTAADPRGTRLYIGGVSASEPGSLGTATVTGAGSKILLTGNTAVISIGRGPGSVGSLHVQDQANVSATSLTVGGVSASGLLAIDKASFNLSGYRTDALRGAGVTVGEGPGAVGLMTLSNGATFTITNNTANGGMSIGGDKSSGGGTGTGTVALSGGSAMTFNGTVTSGIDVGGSVKGTGTMTLADASSVQTSGGITVGQYTGSTGLLSLSGNSTVTASYVGIGVGLGASASGAGTLVLNHGTVTAPTIQNGPGGVITGKWGLLKGNVVNSGQIIPDPPNDPGTLTIDGNFINQAGGSLVLDIAADGLGGFTTSHLVFTAGHTVDLGGLKIEFDFLGTTDPKAFAASGQFNLDTFLNTLNGGVTSGLSTTFTGGASYANWFSSPAQFSFSAESGVPVSFAFAPADGSFSPSAVPEPAGWLLWMAGSLALASLMRRKARRPAA